MTSKPTSTVCGGTKRIYNKLDQDTYWDCPGCADCLPAVEAHPLICGAYGTNCPKCGGPFNEAGFCHGCSPEPKKEEKCKCSLTPHDYHAQHACCSEPAAGWEDSFDFDASNGFWGGQIPQHNHECEHVNHDWQKSFIRRLLAEQKTQEDDKWLAITAKMGEEFEKAEATHQAQLARCREGIVDSCLEIPEEISARFDLPLKDVYAFHLGANAALAAFDSALKGEGL